MGRPERRSTKVRTCKHEQAILGIQCKLVQVGRGMWGEWVHARSERMGTDAVMLQPAGPLTPAQWSQWCPCLPSSAFSDFIFKQPRWEYLHHGNQQTFHIWTFCLGDLLPGELVYKHITGFTVLSKDSGFTLGRRRVIRRVWVEKWHQMI